MGVGGQLHATAALPPRTNTGTIEYEAAALQ